MNIFLHVEVSLRELDSKLLLATMAAARGHQVVISELSEILLAVKTGVFAPGIFHTKSLTPSEKKIARHKLLIDKGFKITSIDEENALVDYGFEEASKDRFSKKSIEQCSAVFGWGPEDVETLKRNYSENSKKIFMTGSPRADLWTTNFSSYWDPPAFAPKRPYLLISSSMGLANNINPFFNTIKINKQIGSYERVPGLLKRQFGTVSEHYRNTFAFIEAIQYLSLNNKGYDIVMRPHPSENIDAWKTFLEDIPNVHVIREGSITAWVKNSFAIMHNGCTTAIEAIISKKPLLTYITFKQDYARELANQLGYIINNPQELLKKVNFLFENIKLDNSKTNNKIPEIIQKKIFLDKDQLATEKIINIWETISGENSSNYSNLKKFILFLKLKKIKNFSQNIFKKFFPKIFGNYQINHKFPPLNKDDINIRVRKLQKNLGLKEKIECKILSDRTIVINKKN